MIAGLAQRSGPTADRIQGIDGDRLRRGLTRLVPAIRWVEQWQVPRAGALAQRAGRRLAGVAGVVNGILIVLPVPFGNTAPAVAVIVLALGLVTGDGVAIGAGLVLTVVATLIDAGLVVLGYAAIAGLSDSIFQESST